jgi:2-keto-4-pentenoate hydratase/2-oxohepta-3-ene-1,7-dioic acid hydratase in catechol pathway
MIANLDQVTARIEKIASSSPVVDLQGLNLLSPVANPGKIIAAPVNYAKHLSEVASDSQLNAGNPGHLVTIQKAGLFLKANSSLVGPGEGIGLWHLERRNDHEVELAVVIGKRANNVSRGEALAHVAGYAIGLDISIRGQEDRSFRKSPDTYAVLGPWLVTADELGDPRALDFTLHVNGERRQAANTRDMIVGIARQIAWASSVYTLYPGDIIMTGTCEGVGPVKPGDVMTVAFERIGDMTVAVR